MLGGIERGQACDSTELRNVPSTLNLSGYRSHRRHHANAIRRYHLLGSDPLISSIDTLLKDSHSRNLPSARSRVQGWANPESH